MALTKKGDDVYITRERAIIGKSGKKLPFPNGSFGFIFDCRCGKPILSDQENCRSSDNDISICYYYFDEEGYQQIKDKVIYSFGNIAKTSIIDVSIKEAVVIDDNTVSIIYSKARLKKYDGNTPHWCQLRCWPSNYDTCVKDFECREEELFHMIIDKNGDQKPSTETTKLTTAHSDRILTKSESYWKDGEKISGNFDWASSNCEANFTSHFRRNFNDGYYLTFTATKSHSNLIVFEFNNFGSYVRTLHDREFNKAGGCSWAAEYYHDNDIDSDFGTNNIGFGNNLWSISDFAKIPARTYGIKFFDITKLSNGKTVMVLNRNGLQVRNIDLFDNFGNMIIHEESINIGDKFGFARIFEFEDGYFVIWREDVRLMIMKFNFDGLPIGEKEKISSFSSSNNIGSVIKDGNKFSIVGWSETTTYPISSSDIRYTFQSTNMEYVIEYINPRSKAEHDMYAYIANNVYIGTVLHDINYEWTLSVSNGCWYFVDHPDRYDEYIYYCYKVVYKRKSLVDLNNIVSIQTPGTLPPTPTPTRSPTSYPTSLPTFSHSPTFLPTIGETSITTDNNLDETNTQNPEEDTGPPDSTDDADSTDDKNPKDTEDSPDSNDNSAVLTVGCVFGSVILLLLCYIKIYNIGCTWESNVEKSTEITKSRRIAFGDNNIREEARV